MELPAVESSAADAPTEGEFAFRSIALPRGRLVREWSPVLALACAGLAAALALAYVTAYAAGSGLGSTVVTRKILRFLPVVEMDAPLRALTWGWVIGGSALVTVLTLIALRAVRRMAAGRVVTLSADAGALRIGRSRKRARVRVWTTISALRAEYAFTGNSGPIHIEARCGRTWLDLGWHGQDTGLVDLIARRAGLTQRTKAKHGWRYRRGG